MSKKNRNADSIERRSDETVQNKAPFIGWVSFDAFWSECVKNGTPAVKSACQAHFKTLGVWDDQTKWLKAAQHFGIPVEK